MLYPILDYLHIYTEEEHVDNCQRNNLIVIIQKLLLTCGPGSSFGIATVRGSNPGGAKIFRTCPDRPWGPFSPLYNGHRVFPGGRKRPGRGADHPPLLALRSRNRVGLYLYSPKGPSWSVKRVKPT
jgi:hypothetical protein